MWFFLCCVVAVVVVVVVGGGGNAAVVILIVVCGRNGTSPVTVSRCRISHSVAGCARTCYAAASFLLPPLLYTLCNTADLCEIGRRQPGIGKRRAKLQGAKRFTNVQSFTDV